MVAEEGFEPPKGPKSCIYPERSRRLTGDLSTRILGRGSDVKDLGLVLPADVYEETSTRTAIPSRRN